MSPRSHHHTRRFSTVGTYVPTPLAERLRAAALFVGQTPAAWLRAAAEEKLARDVAPSIVPEEETV